MNSTNFMEGLRPPTATRLAPIVRESTPTSSSPLSSSPSASPRKARHAKVCFTLSYLADCIHILTLITDGTSFLHDR